MTKYENDDCEPCGEVDCVFCGNFKEIVARSLAHQRRIRRLEKLLHKAREAIKYELSTIAKDEVEQYPVLRATRWLERRRLTRSIERALEEQK